MTDGMADRVAVITGAAGPLGRALAVDLGAAGARVALVGRRRERLDDLAAELELPADRWITIGADLREPAAADDVVRATIKQFGRIDVLAHLVGGYLGGIALLELDPGDIGEMLDRHLWTTLHMVRAVVPSMTAAGWGRIVTVSSPVATSPPARTAPYAIGKAAGEILLLGLARELAGSGVTANVIQVRAIDAEHKRDREPSAKTASWATPEEIVAAIRYLCSEQGGRVNGSRIPLHGAA